MTCFRSQTLPPSRITVSRTPAKQTSAFGRFSASQCCIRTANWCDRPLRRKVKLFSDRQIELVKAFADQAVIAIENVRLFEAEQQRTRELSSLAGATDRDFRSLEGDLKFAERAEPVLKAILENATRICGAKFGNLFLYADKSFRIAAQKNARSYPSDGGSDQLLWLATNRQPTRPPRRK